MERTHEGAFPGVEADFEARLRFLSAEEGGRASLPVVGWRPDLQYEGQIEESSWCVWPIRFFTAEGDIAPGLQVPTEVTADFWILNRDLAKSYHKPRLHPGVRFVICEGFRRVAEGAVTKVFL